MRLSHGPSRLRSRSLSGFSLIEIVLVLLLVALLSGGAISYLVFSASERLLRNTSGEVEVLAKRARTIALLQQKPYALVFSPGLVEMQPLAETALATQGPSIGKTPTARLSDSSDRTDATVQEPVYGQVVIDGSLELTIRRWASDNWIALKDKEVQIWRFDPDGLCEPISIHYANGENWIEDSFHPLTASASSTMMIK